MTDYIEMTDEEWDEQDEQKERAERISEVKRSLAELINDDGRLGYADPFGYEDDIRYEGPLRPLLEFMEENRSEIEELGV